MALTATLDGTVVHLEQRTFGWKRTFIEHWYYDLSNMTRSIGGRCNDPCVRPMDSLAIDWYKKYTRPLLKPIPKAEAYTRGLYTVRDPLYTADWEELDWFDYLDLNDRWLVPVC